VRPDGILTVSKGEPEGDGSSGLLTHFMTEEPSLCLPTGAGWIAGDD